MQAESDEYVRKPTGFFTNCCAITTSLESDFSQACDGSLGVVQTPLLNTYAPQLIATILMALLEKLKENDDLHAVEEIAGRVPAITHCIRTNVNGGYLPDDLVLLARREKVAWYILKVSEKSFQCKSVKMQARSCWI